MFATFCAWMRRQRGASDAIPSIYRFEQRDFIKELGEHPGTYDARSLWSFVLQKSRHSGWASPRNMQCSGDDFGFYGRYDLPAYRR
jgi:hypothetical protein